MRKSAQRQQCSRVSVRTSSFAHPQRVRSAVISAASYLFRLPYLLRERGDRSTTAVSSALFLFCIFFLLFFISFSICLKKMLQAMAKNNFCGLAACFRMAPAVITRVGSCIERPAQQQHLPHSHSQHRVLHSSSVSSQKSVTGVVYPALAGVGGTAVKVTLFTKEGCTLCDDATDV